MQNGLKIYIQDNGWAGMLVAVACSENEARDIMKNEYTYNEKASLIEVTELKKGMLVANYGDA